LNKKNYKFGLVYKNPYLGSKVQEVLTVSKQRLGYIWIHSCGRVIVSPNLGLYVWFGPNGDEWTVETAANWLVSSFK